MKILFWSVIAMGLLGLTLVLCSSPAETHANERTALYNLSSTFHRVERYLDRELEDMGRQLDRIEGKLAACNKLKE